MFEMAVAAGVLLFLRLTVVADYYDQATNISEPKVRNSRNENRTSQL